MKDNKGITLIELMVVLVIFSIVLAGVYGVYITASRQSLKEYKEAESEMEVEITKNFITRDIAMAGYGIADSYDLDEDGTQNFTPTAIGATDGSNAPDTLILMGTALGRLSRAAQGWTYTTENLAFQTWDDVREDLRQDDKVIYMEPNTRTSLSSEEGAWQFNYPDSPATIQVGTLTYGINTADSNFPFYAVEYRLGGVSPTTCASGTQNLQRAESKDNIPPLAEDRLPVLTCVLDFQVAFGLDADEDGTIDTWDNGGAMAALPPYDDSAILKSRLKQIRGYILVQLGNRNADKDVYPIGTTFRVGDADLTPPAGGAGRDIALTDEQRRYRWRVVSLIITPKNLR